MAGDYTARRGRSRLVGTPEGRSLPRKPEIGGCAVKHSNWSDSTRWLPRLDRQTEATS
jgi:hypothetical protein